jgi:hypothetical protein
VSRSLPVSMIVTREIYSAKIAFDRAFAPTFARYFFRSWFKLDRWHDSFSGVLTARTP